MRGLFAIFLFVQFANAQQSQTPPSSINILPVRGNLYMLIGAGANVAASIGRDGVLMVDSQNRQVARDRVRNDIEYEVNVKAELQIAHMHEKVDAMYSAILARLDRDQAPGAARKNSP